MYHQSKTITLLIVDDNPINLKVLIDYLKQEGYETLIAEDGESAIRRAEFAKPDLILLDIMMGDMDGYETCKRLKRNPETKDIPIIFMTALAETSDKVKGFQVGAVDYITKPFQYEEVLIRIKTHLTLQEQKQSLFDLNATKDKLLSIIGHDLRSIFTPLATIASRLKTKANSIEPDVMTRYASIIDISVSNMSMLLSNLIRWAKGQTGILIYNPVEIPLLSTIQEIVDLYLETIHLKGITLSLEIPDHIKVWCDKDMFDTIIRNLISNAVKYTSENDTITIQANESDSYACITIQDTGIGIDEKIMPHLFTINIPFKQNGTVGEKGSGLGLVLCKDLITKNYGHIDIKSELGKGTTIHVQLPLDAKIVTDEGQ